MKENYDFKLGDVVEDLITGFKGVIVVRLRYLYNQDRFGLMSRDLHDEFKVRNSTEKVILLKNSGFLWIRWT